MLDRPEAVRDLLAPLTRPEDAAIAVLVAVICFYLVLGFALGPGEALVRRLGLRKSRRPPDEPSDEPSESAEPRADGS